MTEKPLSREEILEKYIAFWKAVIFPPIKKLYTDSKT